MQEIRVEKHLFNRNSEWFQMLDYFCFLSKNLYNHANYLIRQQYTNHGKWLRYNDLVKILKEDKEYPDYGNMPNAQAAQQTLRYLDNSWSSFFNTIKDWRLHPKKYLGKPKPPKYKDSVKGRCALYLPDQAVRIKESILLFPKTFRGLKIPLYCTKRKNFVKVNQCRIIHQGNHITIEIAYTIDISAEPLYDNQRYLGVDMGIDNLAAVSNNVGLPFYLIDGKGLKSINKYYNKLIADKKSKTKKRNNRYTSRMILNLNRRRTAKIDDYLHKASRWLVNFARENNISVIVIGKNDLWKQNTNLGTKTNQSFVQIPHARFITMVQYKAQEYGIRVELREEAFTSGTSFLDHEIPERCDYNISRRFKRGLFRTNKGIIVNADSNSGLQIIKKYSEDFPIENWKYLQRSLQSPIRQRIKVS